MQVKVYAFLCEIHGARQWIKISVPQELSILFHLVSFCILFCRNPLFLSRFGSCRFFSFLNLFSFVFMPLIAALPLVFPTFTILLALAFILFLGFAIPSSQFSLPLLEQWTRYACTGRRRS